MESRGLMLGAPQGSISLSPQQALKMADTSHFGTLLAGAKQVLVVHAAVFAGPHMPVTSNGYVIIALGVSIPLSGGGLGIGSGGFANVSSIVVDGVTQQVMSAMDMGPSQP